MKHGKKYRGALKKAPQKPVSIEEAVKFVKANPGAKFDETVDVYFRLGKELAKGDTAVRGVAMASTNSLPAHSPKRHATKRTYCAYAPILYLIIMSTTPTTAVPTPAS